MITIGCIDGGLASSGWVALRTDGAIIECIDVDAFASIPYTTKYGQPAHDDRVRRGRELTAWLEPKLVMFRPDVIAAESMSFPKGHNAVVCITLGWGIIIALVESRSLSLVSAQPMRWRKSLVPGGDEDRAHKVAITRVPSFRPLVTAVPTALQVHARDALGVGVWSVSTSRVIELLRHRGLR